MRADFEHFEVEHADLDHGIPIDIWRHEAVRHDGPAPLLIVNDGPEFNQNAELLTTVNNQINEGVLPPLRVAQVEPGPYRSRRDDWYPASETYTRVAVETVMPAICERAPTDTPITALGVSFSALTALHAAHRYPDAYGALCLLSPTFWHPSIEGGSTADHPKYDDVARFTDEYMSSGPAAKQLTVSVVYGEQEPLHYNRNHEYLVSTLERKRHAVSDQVLPGGHNWGFWRHVLPGVLADIVRR